MAVRTGNTHSNVRNTFAGVVRDSYKSGNHLSYLHWEIVIYEVYAHLNFTICPRATILSRAVLELLMTLRSHVSAVNVCRAHKHELSGTTAIQLSGGDLAEKGRGYVGGGCGRPCGALLSANAVHDSAAYLRSFANTMYAGAHTNPIDSR